MKGNLSIRVDRKVPISGLYRLSEESLSKQNRSLVWRVEGKEDGAACDGWMDQETPEMQWY